MAADEKHSETSQRPTSGDSAKQPGAEARGVRLHHLLNGPLGVLGGILGVIVAFLVIVNPNLALGWTWATVILICAVLIVALAFQDRYKRNARIVALICALLLAVGIGRWSSLLWPISPKVGASASVGASANAAHTQQQSTSTPSVIPQSPPAAVVTPSVSSTAQVLTGRWRGDFTSTVSGTKRAPYQNYISLTQTDMKYCTDVGLDEKMLQGLFGDCYSGMWYADADHKIHTAGPAYFRSEHVGGKLGLHGMESDTTCGNEEYTATISPNGMNTYSGNMQCSNADGDHATYDLVKLSPSP